VVAWALFVAGCPSTLVRQWRVDSSSTTELIIGFHKNLKPQFENRRPPMKRAEAMRVAALKLLRGRRYRHRFYWAPFVLVGGGN
jgi:CHAT domain-containing protein